MNDQAPGERSFDFGDWRVLPSRGVLVARAGGEVKIEPRQMDLLLLFATSGGAVISKDRIIASVWNGRVIGDDTLAAAVSRLRASLGATAQNRYIETVPKRGYRLAGPLATRAAPRNVPDGSEQREASRLVAQGLALLRGASPMTLSQAQLYFEAAIRADPRRADAQAGLAETLFAQHLSGQGQPETLLGAARAAAHAAVGLDEACPAGWAALGYARLVVDRDFAGADQALLRAIAIDPSASGPHRSRAFALAAAGRVVEAEREARQAVDLAPLSLSVRGGLLQILLIARRYRQAVAEARSLTALSAQAADAWYSLGWALVFLGEEAEGVDALLRGLALWGLDEPGLRSLRREHEARGFAGLCAAGADLFEAQRVLFTPRPTDIAILRAAAGQPDSAFAALENALARNDPYLLLLPHMPWLDALNNDPRWRPLIERARRVG